MNRLIIVVLILAICTPMAFARKWTDTTGKFTVEAEYVEFKDGKVHLKKQDGKTIMFPIEKLSESDQKFVKQQSSDLPSKRLTNLINKLNGKDDFNAGAAAEQIGKLEGHAKAAVEPLGRYLLKAPIGYQGGAAISLGKIGDKSAIPYLEAALPKMSTRGKAAIHVALLMLEHEPERQVSIIIVILQDKKVQESNDCDFVLGYIRDLGPKGKVFLPTVRDMINLDEHAVRATLARLDDEPEKHVKWLIKELDGSNAAHAAYALGEIGPKAAPAIPKIIELMKKDASTTGNVQFTFTLSGIGAPATKPLGELLKDNNPNIRLHASIALQALGADAKDAFPIILDAREKESDKRVKQELDASIQNIESENE